MAMSLGSRPWNEHLPVLIYLSGLTTTRRACTRGRSRSCCSGRLAALQILGTAAVLTCTGRQTLCPRVQAGLDDHALGQAVADLDGLADHLAVLGDEHGRLAVRPSPRPAAGRSRRPAGPPDGHLGRHERAGRPAVAPGRRERPRGRRTCPWRVDGGDHAADRQASVRSFSSGLRRTTCVLPGLHRGEVRLGQAELDLQLVQGDAVRPPRWAACW